jgi:hypothetical protein
LEGYATTEYLKKLALARKEMEWNLGLFERKTAWAGQRKGNRTQVYASDLSKSSLSAFYI